MLRLHLLTATAAAALAAAPAAQAQTAPPAQTPPTQTTPTRTTPAPVTSAPLASPATTAAAAEPADEATPPQTPATQSPAASPQAAAPAAPAAAGNVIDILTAQGNFTTLLRALNQAELTDTLKSRAAITIFAPTDEAFAALPEAERTRLMDPANVRELRDLLLYHVIVADVSSSQITGTRGGVQTANRTRVLLDGTGEGLRIDGAMITRADIDASNGAVFAIDKVLNPARSMAPPETPSAVATPAPSAASAPGARPAPAAVPAPTGVTATTRPAAPGTNAPDGRPAAATTTIAAPPVPNPTDGQVDSQADPSRSTPPVDSPDPADKDDDTPTPGG